MNILIHNVNIDKLYKIINGVNSIGISSSYQLNVYHNLVNLKRPSSLSSKIVMTYIDYEYINVLSTVNKYNIDVIISNNISLSKSDKLEIEKKCKIMLLFRINTNTFSINLFNYILENTKVNNLSIENTKVNNLSIENKSSIEKKPSVIKQYKPNHYFERFPLLKKYYNDKYLQKIEQYCVLMSKTIHDVIQNPKEDFRYFCYRYLDYMKCIDLPIIQTNHYYEAVLIEYRCLPHVEFLIRNCIIKLGNKWSQTIVCGNLNYEYMLTIVRNIDRNIKVIKTNYDNLLQNEYSLFLASHQFWDLLNGEKILIYQEDTCIFKNNIEEFIQWDYIGAPWLKEQNDTPNQVGNGGLSLRSKSIMKEIINRISVKDITCNSSTQGYMNVSNLKYCPEDVYFSKTMQELNIGKVADWDTAYYFSCESYVHNNSFGAHGVWVNNVQLSKKILYDKLIPRIVRPYDFKVAHRGGWQIVKNVLDDIVIKRDDDIDNNIYFFDILDARFLWGNNQVITTKWIGIIHCTPITPSYMDGINIIQFFHNPNFVTSLSNCLYLITLSNYVAEFLENELQKLNLNLTIKVYTLKHPTDINVPLFEMNKYNHNIKKTLIQVGQQLRKVTSIYRVNARIHKIWLTGTQNIDFAKGMVENECKHIHYENIDFNSVTMKYIKSFQEYDEL